MPRSRKKTSFIPLTDPEFWDQMRELDEIREELDDPGMGLQVSFVANGKNVTVPFVRFRRVFPAKQS